MNSESGETYELMLTRTIRVTHEQMGFHEGWGQCADQLAALVARL